MPQETKATKWEICHVQWDNINHVSVWHDDPINFKIVRRQCFTQKCWKVKEFMDPMDRKVDKSHLSSCFRVTFLGAKKKLRHHADCYRRCAQNLLYCHVSNCHGPKKLDAIKMMCLFMLVRFDDRLEVSTWVSGACDFTSVRRSLQTKQTFTMFSFHLSHKTEFFGCFRSKTCKFHFYLFYGIFFGCCNLPPDGFVYVYAYNLSSVCSMGWRICESMVGLGSSQIPLIGTHCLWSLKEFHASMAKTWIGFMFQTSESSPNYCCRRMWHKRVSFFLLETENS